MLFEEVRFVYVVLFLDWFCFRGGLVFGLR